MADGILSFPFRLTPQGYAATVDPGSDSEVDEALAVLALTVTGERVMLPEFGVPDPAFVGLSLSDIVSGVENFGPAGVRIESVTTEPISDTVARTVVNWSREDAEND